MGVYHSAVLKFIERERTSRTSEPLPRSFTPIESHLSVEEWVHAIIKGANEHSHPSHHLLVLGGLLIGFGSQDEDFISSNLGTTLQKAFVTAANLAIL
jgi:hypothetical protein